MSGEVFLGRYQAERMLGEGGMGKVFLGRQVDTRRQVVIKVMHDHVAENPRFRQNFAREMLLMTRFRHPNAVELYEANIEGPRPCIVMEYLPGATLDALVQKQGRLRPDRVGYLLGQLCMVLQAAHDAGIVHRDLTPVNVMVLHPDTEKETVKVMDFGLARMGDAPYIPLEKLTGATPSGIGGGTPDYVSPEQVRGEETDHRADIYSLGVLLFKVLTGYLPFEQAVTPAEILQCHMELPPPRFSAMGVGSAVPLALEAVVQACLAKYPRERPQTALELGQRYQKALGKRILAEKPIPATILPPPKIETRYSQRTVTDQLEAWMPEPIAVVKLRGFAHDLGGEIVESEPGLIKVRLLDPASVAEKKSSSGLFALMGLGKKKALHVNLHLHLQKKMAEGRNVLNIMAALEPEEEPGRANDPVWRAWAERVCRDLRAYLISR